MSESKPRGKRTNDPEGMRRRVLSVAAEAFQARGYHATSMHDIMALAQMTGGALYHHFPTKKALALAVITETVAAEVQATWIDPLLKAPARQAILGIFEEIAAGLEDRQRVQGCPVNNLALELSLADPDFRAALKGLFDRWRAALRDRLATEATPLPASDMADLIVATYSGAMALAKTDQSAAPLRNGALALAKLWKVE
ncbi:TetR/AcrR family transcriptional regulator [Lacibacterium aquatile]|uniref:TetR/AcrR family transcriptional regulator n=1 Tax=Lacibacterium aquatile TaxID=1168082 RepID=A0ABW5DNJ8_9PROT